MPVSRANQPPDSGARPSQRAARIRSRCPCAKTRASPPVPARTLATTRSARAATSPIVSPPGHGPRQIVQPGYVGPDLRGLAPLERAVVPLHQVGVRPGDRAEPGERRGLGRPRQGAGQDEIEAMTGQPPPEGARLVATDIGQRDVGPARMPAEARPFRLAVADQPEIAEPAAAAVGARRRRPRRCRPSRRPEARVRTGDVGGVRGEELPRLPAEDGGQEHAGYLPDPVL